jgi:hypothetical protein
VAPIGTLDLYAADPRGWDDTEIITSQAYAGVAAGSSVACVPDLLRYGRRNDQENDRPPMLPALRDQLVHRRRRRRGVGQVLAVRAPQGLADGQKLVRA